MRLLNQNWRKKTINKWISVKDRLPDFNTDVLVCAVGKADWQTDDYVITITKYTDCKYGFSITGWNDPWQYFLSNYEITHWMPLPEPPKENSMGNYIDRDKLKDYVMDVWGGNEVIYYKDVIEAIKDAPKADVVPVVHGRWIPFKRDYGDGIETAFRCSVCGHDDSTDDSMKYCPMCGADMNFYEF